MTIGIVLAGAGDKATVKLSTSGLPQPDGSKTPKDLDAPPAAIALGAEPLRVRLLVRPGDQGLLELEVRTDRGAGWQPVAGLTGRVDPVSVHLDSDKRRSRDLPVSIEIKGDAPLECWAPDVLEIDRSASQATLDLWDKGVGSNRARLLWQNSASVFDAQRSRLQLVNRQESARRLVADGRGL